MKWSRYNFLYEQKNEYFLYNTRSNSFMKLNAELFAILDKMRLAKDVDFSLFNEDEIEQFIKKKIFVKSYEDDNYVIQKKYLKQLKKFDEKTLGLVIVPTTVCNFACPYCYEQSIAGEIMSEKTINDLISFTKSFNRADKIELCWHGGEPLMAFDVIKKILDKLNDNHIEISKHSLVSNGYLLDKDKCLFFKKYKLNSVQITIDGLSETHNRSRVHKSGLPTYETIVKNIDTVFDVMPECLVKIRMNVHNANKEEAHILYDELTRRWKGQNMWIYFVFANEHEGCKASCIKDQNLLSFAKQLYEHGIYNINFYPKAHNLRGCTADYNNSFVIGPKGELYKCWVDVGRTGRIIGNITDKKLNLPLISEYVSGVDMFNDSKCLECLLFPICDGGCGLHRLEYKISGKEYNNCPISISDLPILLDMAYLQIQSNS